MTTSPPSSLPNKDRLSVVTATIVAALLSGFFIRLPALHTTLALPGFVVPIQIDVTSGLAFLLAALTVAGVDWILSDHPALGTRTTLPHWLLPGLTAWVLEIVLRRLPLGAAWWGALGIGLLLWLLVIVGEYIVIDGKDARYPLAAAGLTGLGFLLFFLLVVAVRSAGLRLFFTAPMVGLAAGIVTLRTFNLQRHGQWQPVETIFIMALVAQIEAAFHYLPIPPAAFGIILAAPTYAATVFINNILEEQPPSQAIAEPLAVLVLALLLLLWAWL